jgi:hypothetical protein
VANASWFFFWFPLGDPAADIPATQSRSGLERAGAARTGYYTPNLVVTIDGSDRTADVMWEGLDVALSSNDEPDEVSFSLRPGTTIPTDHQVVTVCLGSADNPIFGGTIRVIERDRRAGFPDPFVRIQAQSYLRHFDRRLVTAAYTNTSATAILQDVLDHYTNGFSGAAIQGGMSEIENIQITNERPSTVFRKVTGLVGGGFRVDGRRVVHAWEGPAESGAHSPTPPVTLDESEATVKRFAHSYDGSQLRTRVIVQGNGSRTVFDAAAGDTELVIEDGTYFSTTGGSAIVERNVITYTGVGTRYVQSRDWKTQLAPQNNRWRAITWSAARGLFVALAFDGTNRAMYSSDGMNWTLAPSPLAGNSWLSVVYADALGYFVAVSFDGTYRVAISGDGVAWYGVTASQQNAWSEVAWSQELGLLVAVSVDGVNRVMTSTDSTSWTNRTAAAANQWVSVAWAPSLGLFAAVAADAPSGSDAVMTSPDGVTWTSRTLAFNNWATIAWAEDIGRFVALNANEADSMAAYSSDGISWSTVAIPAGAWIGLVWSSELGLFVACSEQSSVPARIITSPDGITWSTDFTDDIDTDGASIAWSPELGIFVVGTGDDRHPILTNSPSRYPTLDGIPDGGEGSIVHDVPKGEDVKIRVQVDDTVTQAAIAAIEGGDGIYEHIVQDGRYNIEGATARANAELTLFASPIQEASWETDDMRAMPGAAQAINYGAPGAYTATLPITRVSFRFLTKDHRPHRVCQAATVKQSGIADVIVTDPN